MFKYHRPSSGPFVKGCVCTVTWGGNSACGAVHFHRSMTFLPGHSLRAGRTQGMYIFAYWPTFVQEIMSRSTPESWAGYSQQGPPHCITNHCESSRAQIILQERGHASITCNPIWPYHHLSCVNLSASTKSVLLHLCASHNSHKKFGHYF